MTPARICGQLAAFAQKEKILIVGVVIIQICLYAETDVLYVFGDELVGKVVVVELQIDSGIGLRKEEIAGYELRNLKCIGNSLTNCILIFAEVEAIRLIDVATEVDAAIVIAKIAVVVLHAELPFFAEIAQLGDGFEEIGTSGMCG